MMTFRTVSDSLGEALFFQVDGREAGYVSESLNGTFTVFFADMTDAPQGVTLERSTAPGSQGIYAVGIASLDDAIALIRRTYSDSVSTTDTAAPATPASPVFPRSIPSALARDVVRAVPLVLSLTTERAAFFGNAASPSSRTARNTQ